MLYFLVAVALAVGVAVYLMKTGKIKDEDGNFIPDVIEDKVKDIKEDVQEVVTETKRRVERVKEELKDVKEAVKNVGAQAKDIASAAKGKPRRGRKPQK